MRSSILEIMHARIDIELLATHHCIQALAVVEGEPPQVPPLVVGEGARPPEREAFPLLEPEGVEVEEGAVGFEVSCSGVFALMGIQFIYYISLLPIIR